MAIDLDTLIFVGFLLVNLVVGLFYSRGVSNVTQYAIGTGFSTSALVATIVATNVDGAAFSIDLTESYRQGLYYIITVLAFLFRFLFVSYFLIPRMGQFFDTLSIAEAIGKFYGNLPRIITAVLGVILSIGYVAIQFKIAGSLIQLFFTSISSIYAIMVACGITILYSIFGGIKAVTFTDILQFFTFGVIIPFICLTIWGNADTEPLHIFNSLSDNPLFDLKEVFNLHNPLCLSMLSLLLVCTIPAFDPAFYQRIVMTSGINQAKKSFIIAGLILTGIYSLVSWIAVIIFAVNPNLDPDHLLIHIIETYTYPGFKGLAAIGVMACIMSTADSYMNCASVLLGHDVIKLLKINISPQKELILLRLATFIIGCLALTLAYGSSSLLHLYMKMLSLYMPVVSVPLYAAIFGFQNSGKVIVLGMIAGLLSVSICSFFTTFESGEVIIGMLSNLTVLIMAQFKCGGSSRSVIITKKIFSPISKIRKAANNFSFLAFSKRSLAKQSYLYVTTGIISIISLITCYEEALKQLQATHFNIHSFIYQSCLISSFVLVIHQLLPRIFRNETFYFYLRLCLVSYSLLFIPFLLAILSNFGKLQTMILLVNITIFSFITKWRLALIILAISAWAGIKSYELVLNLNDITLYNTNTDLYFQIIYVLMLASVVPIAFLKPKQEEQELSAEIIEYLSHEVEDQRRETSKAVDLKNKFLRNLQHETHTPLTGVYSMSQVLDELYHKLTDEQRKAAIRTIHTSSERLASYFNNMLDLSKLRCLGYEIILSKVNLSRLLDYTLTKCQKLYISRDDQEGRDFVLDIEPDIMLECDKHYIGRAMENIITNAIQYCKKGQITITLRQMKDQNPEQDNIIFSVKDSGVGIPNKDLNKIFDSFTVSSKTDTSAEGRGVGLTLAKTAIELHKGNITCTSDGQSGSCFTVTIPILAIES